MAPTEIQVQMLAENNRLRASQALIPHTCDLRLMYGAQEHAQFMALNGNLSHNTNGGMTGHAYHGGWTGTTLCENIAAGQQSVGVVFQSWRNSAGHWRNIKSHTNGAGFGYALSPSGCPYWCALYGESLTIPQTETTQPPPTVSPTRPTPRWWRWVSWLIPVCVGILLLSSAVALEETQTPPWLLNKLPEGCSELINLRPLHDADTPKGDIILKGPRYGSQQIDVIVRDAPIRLRGFDAWEVDKTRSTGVFKDFTALQWKEEIVKGIRAREALKTLSTNTRWMIKLSSNDSVFSRKEGEGYLLLTDGRSISISVWAKENGHDRDTKVQRETPVDSK